MVLDEADRMADMGFIKPVCQILDECRRDRQTILFSATLDDEVADLVRDYQNNPVTIEVGPKEVSMDSMTHYFWLMPNSKKSTICSEVIRKCGRTIVFFRSSTFEMPQSLFRLWRSLCLFVTLFSKFHFPLIKMYFSS